MRSTATSTFYAVAIGRMPGIYATWAECKEQVTEFPGARYKKFLQQGEAEQFVQGNGSRLLAQLGTFLPSSPPPVPKEEASAADPHAQDALVVFTDGSALSNGRKGARGGYAAVFPHHPQATVAAPLDDPNPTNNRAEYTALLVALRAADHIDPSRTQRLFVYTDSKLLLQSITQWMPGWKKRGWKKATGGAVLNRDLLEQIDAFLPSRRVVMHHVLAHTGRSDWKSHWNQVADQHAREAAARASSTTPSPMGV